MARLAFDAHDLGRLVAGARQVPGFDPGATGLAVVSLSGVAPGTESVGLVWGAGDVLSAWAP